MSHSRIQAKNIVIVLKAKFSDAKKDTFQLEYSAFSLLMPGHSSSIVRKKVLTWDPVDTVRSLTVPPIMILNFFKPFLKLF